MVKERKIQLINKKKVFWMFEHLVEVTPNLRNYQRNFAVNRDLPLEYLTVKFMMDKLIWFKNLRKHTYTYAMLYM